MTGSWMFLHAGDSRLEGVNCHDICRWWIGMRIRARPPTQFNNQQSYEISSNEIILDVFIFSSENLSIQSLVLMSVYSYDTPG